MIIKRRYYDITENEEWLNEMAQDGHAMNDCCAGLFTDTFSFEKCEPGEYIFRVLMLDHNVNHPESMRYLRFLRESGVEHIASNGNAVYLRKKAADSPFDILTDRDSRLKYHIKMVHLYAWSLLTYPIMLLSGFGIILFSRLSDEFSQWWYIGAGLAGGVVIGLLLTLSIFLKCCQALRHHRKIVKRLKHEGLLYE
jgi:hypothetical protein